MVALVWKLELGKWEWRKDYSSDYILHYSMNLCIYVFKILTNLMPKFFSLCPLECAISISQFLYKKAGAFYFRLLVDMAHQPMCYEAHGTVLLHHKVILPTLISMLFFPVLYNFVSYSLFLRHSCIQQSTSLRYTI